MTRASNSLTFGHQVLIAKCQVPTANCSQMKILPLRSTMCGMDITRRSFVALSAALPFALRAHASTSSIPIGLELYSVREALKQDLDGTVRAVAKMGYQCVEFYGPYFEWSESQTKQIRKLLDDLGIKCYSKHNDEKNFNAENIN